MQLFGIALIFFSLFSFFEFLVTANNDWDLLIFTQHWPPTVCVQYEENGDNNVCLKPRFPGTWTIHGLWPTKGGTFGPFFCSNTKFNSSLLNPIHEDLVSYWPNLQHGKGESSLWNHEWTKHGTCAASLPAFDTEEKYFQKGLELFAKYNMTSLLRNGGIIPSDKVEYRLEDIRDAVQKTLGVNPQIQCIIEKFSHKPYLFELRVCFDKNLSLIGCEGIGVGDNPTDLLTNCPLGQKVVFPVAPDGPNSGASRSYLAFFLIGLCSLIYWL